MSILACLNGELMPVEEAKISVWDRGFLFGDAVYEVFRIYRGRLWLEAEHTARLKRSLKAMEFPEIDVDQVVERVKRTVLAAQTDHGTAYIQITRGVAMRSHPFPKPAVPPTEVIIVRPYDDGPTAAKRESGVPVFSQPDYRWGRCDVKSTNLLANVIALEYAQRAGGFEAILINRDGLVTEATHSSVMWVRDGQLQGTPDGHEILPGTKRHFVETLLPSIGMTLSTSRITLDELKACEEVLLIGTTIEVLGVTSIDDQTIGQGKPGPITRQLQGAYWAAVERWLEDVEG
jgi:D-alanine transaminase